MTHVSNGHLDMAKPKRRYFPNKYKLVSDTDPDLFPQIPYESFYEDLIYHWTLPLSHDCVIRSTNLKTGKVKERSYKYRGAAYKFIEKNYKTHEFVVADHDSVHKLSPNPPRYNNEEKNTRD